MPGWTNKGKVNLLKWGFQKVAIPTNLYLALVTDDDVPDADTNVLGDLTEITAGNGYTTGGYQLNMDATDFDTLTEDDGSDLGSIQIKDVIWTASGGTIPSAGGGARYAVLIDDNGTVANREVLAYFDLGSSIVVSDTQTLTLADHKLSLNES